MKTNVCHLQIQNSEPYVTKVDGSDYSREKSIYLRITDINTEELVFITHSYYMVVLDFINFLDDAGLPFAR